MKKIFLITSLLPAVLSSAQVGIKTANPVNMLDINGDMNLRGELRVAGSNSIASVVGPANTIYHNNSDLIANDWKSIKIADGQGSNSLSFMNTVIDRQGVKFSGSNGVIAPYVENTTLDNSWTVIPGAVDTFMVTNTTNKVVFSLQTIVQKSTNGNLSISFACGIFVDNKLRAVRSDVIVGGDGTNKIFNLNATLANLTPKPSYSVKAACAKRNLNSGTLGIGTAVNTTYLNADMAQTVLTTSVIQPY